MSFPPGRVGSPSISADHDPPSGGAVSGAQGQRDGALEPALGRDLERGEPPRRGEVRLPTCREPAGRLDELADVGRELVLATLDHRGERRGELVREHRVVRGAHLGRVRRPVLLDREARVGERRGRAPDGLAAVAADTGCSPSVS